MSKIEKFEDLVCWQKTRLLVKEIYNITHIDVFNKDFALKDQIRRSMISVLPEYCRRIWKKIPQRI
ncbi:MAG: four helix bundle protein [Ignavibacteria bacterium]